MSPLRLVIKGETFHMDAGDQCLEVATVQSPSEGVLGAPRLALICTYIHSLWMQLAKNAS